MSNPTIPSLCIHFRRLHVFFAAYLAETLCLYNTPMSSSSAFMLFSYLTNHQLMKPTLLLTRTYTRATECGSWKARNDTAGDLKGAISYLVLTSAMLYTSSLPTPNTASFLIARRWEISSCRNEKTEAVRKGLLDSLFISPICRHLHPWTLHLLSYLAFYLKPTPLRVHGILFTSNSSLYFLCQQIFSHYWIISSIIQACSQWTHHKKKKGKTFFCSYFPCQPPLIFLLPFVSKLLKKSFILDACV